MTLTLSVEMKEEDSPPDYDQLQPPSSNYVNTEISRTSSTIPHPIVIKSLSEAYKQLINCSSYYSFFDSSNARVLESQPNGTFLIRPSSHPHYLYTISVSEEGTVINVRIRLTDEGLFRLEDGGRSRTAPHFRTLIDLVCYYMHQHTKAYYTDSNSFRLLFPYRKYVPSLQSLAKEEIMRNTRKSQFKSLLLKNGLSSIYSTY